MAIQIIHDNGEYFLDKEDISIIREFNNQVTDPDLKLLTNLHPEPYIGNYETAKVILLALNPGFKGPTEKDEGEMFWHKQDEFITTIQDNLKLIETDFPYYYLDDTRFHTSPGHIWAKRIYGQAISRVGHRNLSQKICCVQYHGYHSKRYRNIGKLLPSQQKINFMIIEKAISKKLPIIIMRSTRLWTESILSLKEYNNKVILKNPRNPVFSPNNMGEAQFEELISLIKE